MTLTYTRHAPRLTALRHNLTRDSSCQMARAEETQLGSLIRFLSFLWQGLFRVCFICAE